MRRHPSRREGRGRSLHFSTSSSLKQNRFRLPGLGSIHILARASGREARTGIFSGVLTVLLIRPVLPPDYRPSEDEEFMNPMQREYFRQKLIRWRAELMAESSETLQRIKDDSLAEPDLNDRATLETDRSLELRTRDRERKLVSKIDAALLRIEDGSYGFCEVTAEPIGLRRLEARPIATLSLEAQERHERHERTHRND